MSNTNKTIENLKSKRSLSRTIRHETKGFMREELQNYREHASQINTDRRLSADGKAEKLQQLKRTYENRDLQLSQRLKQEEQNALDVAKAGARKILTNNLPTVDAQKQKLFNQRADALTAKATFATSSGDMIAAIRELSELAADEPKLSANALPNIMRLSEKALANTGPNDIVKNKKVLQQIYETTSDNALPPYGKESCEIIGTAESIEQTPMFIGAVPEAMKEITLNTSKYINTPEMYLEQQDGQQGGGE